MRNALQLLSIIITGTLRPFNVSANWIDHGYDPIKITPLVSAVINFKRRANGLIIRLCKITLITTTAKAMGRILSPSSNPASINNGPITPAIAAHTTPRGAINPASAISRHVSFEKPRHTIMVMGRITNNSAITNTTARQLISVNTDISRLAVNNKNTPETNNNVMVSLNRRISSILAVWILAMVMPNTVTAINPDSWMIMLHAKNNPKTADKINGDFKYSGI